MVSLRALAPGPNGIRRSSLFGLSILLLAYAVVAVTSEKAETVGVALEWTTMGMGLFGGLALFLFGMEQMSDSIKAVAGTQMKDLLARLTKNRVTAAITGAAVTAIIQSSSVTTVLVVGFVSAGLMTMTQSIGIIMGANVGTTMTAQIVAFKVTEAALAFIALGFAMMFFGKTEKPRHYGGVIMGLGLIFFGMGIMSEAMSPLRGYEPFIAFMGAMQNPLLGILVAAAFTALVQSSSATTGIVVVMASQGFITLPAGIAMALGANIGTCVTALLSAIGKPTEAVRAAAVHVVFNILGALLWVGFIDQLADIAIWMSPVAEGLSGAEKLAAETPRQIANANTAFNLINTILFLPLAGVIARLVIRLVPEKPVPIEARLQPKYLDTELVETPALALERVRLELGHMGELVRGMYDGLPAAMRGDSTAALDAIVKADEGVDRLEEEIFAYLARVRANALSEREASEFQRYVNATGYLEGIGDIMESELVPIGRRFLGPMVEPSNTLREIMHSLYDVVGDSLSRAVDAVALNDSTAAQAVIDAKPQVTRIMDRMMRYQAEHLGRLDRLSLVSLRTEVEVMERLRHIYTKARRMAKESLPGQAAEDKQNAA